MTTTLKKIKRRLDRMSIDELKAAMAELDRQHRQAVANLDAQHARKMKRLRALDTRRKAVLGTFVLFRLEASRDTHEVATVRTWLRRALPLFLTRTIDQVMLSDLIADGPAQAMPAPADAQAARARDTRRKILLGALVLHHLETEPDLDGARDRAWLKQWLASELPAFVTRKVDAAVLADALKAEPTSPASSATDVGSQPRPDAG